jgi:hypothetical protein
MITYRVKILNKLMGAVKGVVLTLFGISLLRRLVGSVISHAHHE